MKIEEMLNKVICGDCLEVMKDIPDKSVDLVLTDPPYEQENHGGGTGKMWRQICNGNIDFLSNGFDYQKVFQEFERICKIVNIIIFCSNKQISKTMKYFEDKNYSVVLLVWDKTNAVPFGNGKYISNAEFMVYVRGKNATYNNEIENRGKIFRYNYPPNRQHPTEKPIEIIRKLLEIHSNPKSIILDPFLGSGTTAVACKHLKRNYIGIEINPAYVKIANERLRQDILL